MSEVSIQTVSVGVLLPFEYNFFQVGLILDVLKSTNQYCYQNGIDFRFDIEIVQTQGQINENSNAFYDIPVTNTLTEKSYNLVFIPPMESDDILEILDKNKVFKDWMVEQHEQKAQMYTFSNAVNLLAYAGLLDQQGVGLLGLDEAFYSHFSSILKSSAVSIQKLDQIILSAGNQQIFYTLFELIDHHLDFAAILYLSKKYLVPLSPPEMRYFYDFDWIYESGDTQIDIVLEKIHAEYATINSLEEVLDEYTDSRRHFNRQFLQLVKMTPLEYLQRIRIAQAKYLLVFSELSVEEICHQVGYDDLKSFRIIFIRNSGILPLEYRKRMCNPFV